MHEMDLMAKWILQKKKKKKKKACEIEDKSITMVQHYYTTL
jgi:hypothetical protein